MAKSKLYAAGKMVFGAGRVLSGVVTGTGHGALGAFCRNHHQMRCALMIAKRSIEGGADMFREGLDEWHDANA